MECPCALFPPYEACSLAKLARIIYRIPHSLVVRLFQRIHIDLCGKMTNLGIRNKSYFVIFIDDYSRHR